jgi:hypothetical protein
VNRTKQYKRVVSEFKREWAQRDDTAPAVLHATFAKIPLAEAIEHATDFREDGRWLMCIS